MRPGLSTHSLAAEPAPAGGGGPIPEVPASDTHAKRTAKLCLARSARRDRACAPLNLFEVGFEFVRTSVSGGASASMSVGLTLPATWTHVGRFAVSGATTKAFDRLTLHTRAVLSDGRVYEGFLPAGGAGVVGLSRNATPIGCWRLTDFTYDGRWRAPLTYELWTHTYRVGIVDAANLSAGAAALELDADGSVVIPVRVKPFTMPMGNPLVEFLKSTPLRRLPIGSLDRDREPGVGHVLSPHAALLAPDEAELLFAASLFLVGLCHPLPTGAD